MGPQFFLLIFTSFLYIYICTYISQAVAGMTRSMHFNIHTAEFNLVYKIDCALGCFLVNRQKQTDPVSLNVQLSASQDLPQALPSRRLEESDSIEVGIREPVRYTEIYLNEEMHYPNGFEVIISPAEAADWEKAHENLIQIWHTNQAQTGKDLRVTILRK